MDEEKRQNLKEVIEWIICIIIAVVLALIVRHFVFTPTIVRQVSMKPTLEQWDRLILNRWSITTKGEIKRGEIITFEAPSNVADMEKVDGTEENTQNPVAVYDNEPKGLFSKFLYYVIEYNKTSYIKRVIGVAGDHILIENGKVYLNGEELQEEYLRDDVVTTRTGQYYDVTVPEGYVFAMGDNRAESIDCRVFGCIPIEKIESKVLIRFWPFSKFGKV